MSGVVNIGLGARYVSDNSFLLYWGKHSGLSVSDNSFPLYWGKHSGRLLGIDTSIIENPLSVLDFSSFNSKTNVGNSHFLRWFRFGLNCMVCSGLD